MLQRPTSAVSPQQSAQNLHASVQIPGTAVVCENPDSSRLIADSFCCCRRYKEAVRARSIR